MNKTKQIIVRMTTTQKQDLENIAKANGGNVSKLVRDLIYEYIRQHTKNK
ncbi:MAG: ribbon-helix-helix domain-containing protein [Clostridia bacterium]|nr:ribbon-helix-helix domain-containing protein [Clostridia bacterium]